VIASEDYKGAGVPPNDCDGTIFALGYNLIGETSGCTINGLAGNGITGTGKSDLFDLGFFGGSTPTHRLRSTSEARDAGSPSAPNDVSFLACREDDQRGNPRPADGGGGPVAVCDIGAVEMQ
jgi:hypothetical protein